MTFAAPGGRRLVIVGCGAAARICHLPALAPDGPFRLVALVDRVPGSAVAAAARYRELRAGRPASTGENLQVGVDLQAVLPNIDAAIIATAHGAHAEVAVALLRAGKHVLIEKPLALTVAQCEQIRAAAAEGAAVAMPAHVRRLFPAARWVRSVLDSGRLGAVRRIRWSEGRPYAWPLVSSFMFAPARTGGGVLADSGPHVFDLLLYWLAEPAHVVSFAHNADGGSDSEVSVGLAYGRVRADVELSRLRELGNMCVIEAEHGTLSIETGFPAGFVECDASGKVVDSGPVPVLPPAQDTWVGLFRAQLADFDRVIDGQPTQLAAFDEGVASVRLIEQCQGVPAARLPRPWTGPCAPSRVVSAQVAVTGATGFIGSHVVEQLLATGGSAVAIARDLAKLARLSHLDSGRVGFARADVRDRGSLAEAFRGSEVVVHTVYGSEGSPDEQWSVTVGGTAAVLDAAIVAGVRRIVYISTVAVYDTANRAAVDEECPTFATAPGDLCYGQQKLAAERHISTAGAGRIEVVCLQPTVVYGPWGPSWTVRPLRRLPVANYALPTGATAGTCNAVHVQDVADAVLFAATADGLDGARLLVSGPQPVSWGAFYDAYRSMLGLERPERSDPAGLEDWERDLYGSPAVVDTERIRAAGFEARVGFTEGIAHVAAWASWAGLS
jgi:predicted dehydrogenase/nucleoside-diphosphate-sugar epimerase